MTHGLLTIAYWTTFTLDGEHRRKRTILLRTQCTFEDAKDIAEKFRKENELIEKHIAIDWQPYPEFL